MTADPWGAGAGPADREAPIRRLPPPGPESGRVSIRLLRLSVGLILSAVLFWLAYENARGEEVWGILRQGRLCVGILFAAAVVDTMVLVLRSIKWRLILLPVKRVRLRSTFSATAVGVMTNNLLPLRIDEVVRAYLLGRREGLPAPVVFGTVAVERTADIAVLLVTVMAATFLMPVPARWAAATPYVWAALGAVAALMLAAAAAGGRIAQALRRSGERRGGALLDRLAGACEDFTRAVRAFPRDWRLPAVLGLTVTEMACSVIVAWMTAATLGLTLSAQALVVVVLGGYLSFAIPSSPGSIGVYESINCVALTSLYAVPKAEALAFVLLLHAMLIVPSSLIGLACLWRERVGLGRLVREGTRPARVAEGAGGDEQEPPGLRDPFGKGRRITGRSSSSRPGAGGDEQEPPGIHARPEGGRFSDPSFSSGSGVEA